MYTLIALGIQFSALILMLNKIGTPYSNIIAITGFIPVMILNNMENRK